MFFNIMARARRRYANGRFRPNNSISTGYSQARSRVSSKSSYRRKTVPTNRVGAKWLNSARGAVAGSRVSSGVSLGGRLARYAGAAGRAASRVVPYLGAASLAYDAGRAIYNRFKRTPTSYYNASNSGYAGRFPGIGGQRNTAFVAKQCGNKGIKLTFEYGGVTGAYTAPDEYKNAYYCQTIGHCSMPQRILLRLIYGSIIRKVLDKMQYGTYAAEQRSSLFRSGDSIRICYRNNLDNTVAAEAFISISVANDDSFTLLVTKMVAVALTLSGANNTSQLQFLYVQYLSSGGAVDGATIRVNLIGASVTLYSKSTMVIQNRTTNVSDSKSVDTIDSLPLGGKMYVGKHTGSKFRYDSTETGVNERHENPVGNTQGLIEYSETSAESLREPLPSSAFYGVKSSAGINLEVGSMKESVLSFSRTMKLSNLMNMYYGKGIADHEYMRIGDHCFFMLEKKLEVVGFSTPTIPIRLGWELNFESGAYLTLSPQKYMIQENFINENIPQA